MVNFRAFTFLVASFVVAILLIAFGPEWADHFGRGHDVAPSVQVEVGQIQTAEGSSSRRHYGQDKFRDFKTPVAIRNLDTLQIQSRAKVQLTLNGYKLALAGPALMVFELWNSANPTGPIVLHLISGQMNVLTEGEAGKLYVVRKGELQDPKGASVVRERSLLVTPLSIGEPPSAPVLPTPTLSANKAATNPISADQEEDSALLSNEYLDSEIAKQQEQFQRCQNNALREQGEVKGQILVGLTISPDGKVDNARILASTLQDDKLHSCLLQVFQRIKFKTFTGAPIVRSYPLNFE